MRIIVDDKKSISITKLPNQISENYWILDNNSKNLINVVAEEGKWLLKSNTEIKISKSEVQQDLSNINYLDSVVLEGNVRYYLYDIMNKKEYIMYTLPSYESYINLVIDYNKVDSIIIGNSESCDINVNNQNVSNTQLSIEVDKKSNLISIKNLDVKNNLYINNNFCTESYLTSGDIIFIGGIYIYYFGSVLLVSNSNNNVVFNSLKLSKMLIKENPEVDYSNLIDKDIKLFEKNMYFQRPPRFKRKIEKKEFTIDAPTQKEKEEETPLIFTIAPMLTMGMMSLVTGITSLQKVLEGESTLKDEFSSLLTCGCMMLAMIVFPIVQKFYNKIKKREKERKRRRKYKKYIDARHDEIFKEINFQKQVLIEDNLSPDKVKDVIINRQRTLWERKSEHDDFLELRLGIGVKKPDVEIKYPEEHFTMDEDDLKDIITNLVNESKDIENVPITLNFRKNNKVGLIGSNDVISKFYDNLMLQIMAYHGYDMLRIIILTSNKNKNYWEKYRNLPYLWNNDKSIRYFASNKDDINKITSLLMEEYNYRKEMSEGKEVQFSPYYLVITDEIDSLKNNVFVKEILKNKNNLGYSIVMNVEKLDILPNECSMFINVARGMSGIFTNQMTMDNQIAFEPDLLNFSLRNCINAISNIPIDINSGKFVLPKKYGFLEMYDVGNVKQLNILNRWKNNDVINSLSCPVGIDEQGELFNLDLHEKAHGPHGLVAGMTGSGKSEWIITYILSMAVNYSPEEVQFVLIDYKGGGLALTFDNVENNIKLPHVVGTLTNLDVVEMKRSLASINSELKRRQTMFKKAREKLNESSMDIYKYQDLYRKGSLDEPMSHLFIISDEFAELKAQQPDFMDELISTARIGRSLGVHLILATQKPSGVVDDQIWSNSKFKVCLKVQDKSDSNEMIKCQDAALLKETGRFYLQVGYNEFFAKGQSAYAGMPYYESDKKLSLVDSTVDFVDEIGALIKKGDVEKVNKQYVHKGEELPNVLNYIINTAKTEKLKIKPLWLSKIPGVIYIDKLLEKYEWKKEDFVLNPIVGEYDVPNKQEQNILTAPFSAQGNMLLYGSAGSGKELFLTTLMSSLILHYTPQEVIIYVLDFGSGVLKNFADASHVGDVVTLGQDEKIENLFKVINTEISIRRNKFASFNGNYSDYISKSEEKMSNIVVIINQYEVFAELYQKMNEHIIDLTRECARFGIFFILSTSSSSAIKTKVSQNFKMSYCLQMNDEFSYRSLVGASSDMVPSPIYGRGLVKLDQTLEFQTAYLAEKDNLYKKVAEICVKSYIKYKVKAAPIPVLPEKVSINDVSKEKITYKNIPVGLIKNNLEVASFDVTDYSSYLISFRNFDTSINFIDKFLTVINSNLQNVFVFDAKYLYEENKFNNLNYINSNFNDPLEKLQKFVQDIKDLLEKNNNNIRVIKDIKDVLCVIIGFDKFVCSLSPEDKKVFENIMNSLRDCIKLHFIIMDIPNELKKYEYEMWYKSAVNSSSGVWLGDGFGEQFAIKATKVIQAYYEEIGSNYGYLVENGQVEFIKVIEK